MILYGFSIQGKSHIDKETVCQDSNKTGRLRAGYYFGAVADGVGSAPHSDIGSKLAVEKLYEYCDKNIKKGMDQMDVEDVLCAGYEYAMETIQKYADSHDKKIENYDTTLSAVIYNGKKIIYAHAGDGGIIVRQTNGIVKPVTKRQKGADGTSVIPLRAGEHSWEIGTYSGNVAAVLLVTDGMLDGVFQPTLLNLPSSTMELARGDFSQDNVYIAAAEFFMNPYAVYKNPKIKGAESFLHTFLEGNLLPKDQDAFLQCMDAAYTKLFNKKTSREICESLKEVYFVVGAVKNVKDDKSVVCLINETIEVVPQDKKYYLEPDWVWLQECYEALLYGKEPPVKDDDEKDDGVNGEIEDRTERKTEGETGDDRVEKKLKDEEKERRRNKVKRRRKAALIAAIGVLAVSLVILVICLISLFSSDTDKKQTNSTQKPKVTAVLPTATPTPTPKVTDNPSTASGSAVTVDDMIENLNNEEYISSLPDSKKEKLDEACRIYQNMREEEAVKENREGAK
jgi:hypothetical protein